MSLGFKEVCGMTIKILNLYAGIGGNRKLWGKDVEVTAVEHDENIAKIYQDYFPNDRVIVGDAHEYLKENYKNFDFIWTSPPCPTHSRMRMNHKKKVYPDLKLYEEILFLKHFCKDKLWVVENVVPYYKPLIEPTKVLHRHVFWCNFDIKDFNMEKLGTCKIKKEREFLQEKFGYNLDGYTGIDKRKVLRNCVVPVLGKHIKECALNESSNICKG
jgi:DNA (cytosine-5)-methyltransferase 1